MRRIAADAFEILRRSAPISSGADHMDHITCGERIAKRDSEKEKERERQRERATQRDSAREDGRQAGRQAELAG